MLKANYWALLFTFLLCSSLSYAQKNLIQNIQSRNLLSLNGKWNYIVDPYENGYYDYRHEPFDQSASKTGGFYDDRQCIKRCFGCEKLTRFCS